jgi:membrane-associated phospholipid phosphatase
VHFASDVLGSFFIAIWWLTFMHLVFGLNYNHNASKNAMREPEILITLEQTV